MPTNFKTPGVYIEEKNAFPNSAVAVETAVPAFIGYTEKAEWNGKSLLDKPTRVTSFAEYVERFGAGFEAKFFLKVAEVSADPLARNIAIENAKKVQDASDLASAKAKDAEEIAVNAASAKVDADAKLADATDAAEKAKTDAASVAANATATPEEKTAATAAQTAADAAKAAAQTAVDTAKTAADTAKTAADAATKDAAAALKLAVDATKLADASVPKETFTVGRKQMYAELKPNNTLYLFNCIRLFYANGGGPCYIIAVDTYKDKPDGIEVKGDDFLGSATKVSPFELLKKEFEPTLIVIPDAIALGEACYNIYTMVLKHCMESQSRFGIFDLAKQSPSQTTTDVVTDFREAIGVNDLKYGAAYYPWLKTAIVQPSEVTFENLDASVDLERILPAEEVAALDVVKKYKSNTSPKETDKLNFHQALKATSPTYNNILGEIRNILNELPPSAAMAGQYTAVDNSRGVWKSPANISLNMVNAPMVNITSEQQENLNVDVMAGKSINVIRSFPGIGTLVWGGRTLDGNSQDWRYINVRRTLIMIEQSLKLSARAYVFEPNDANTWITVKCMISNFLTNLWKQGALAGSVPEQAFDVQIGLGATMTPTDILDGKMLISVKVAIVRPAEFIVITFQQQMQQS